MLGRGHALDRAPVRREVALRIGLGTRALAEHVVAEAQQRLRAALVVGLVHRLVDVAAEHELPAEQLDRAHRRGHHRVRAESLEQAGLAVGLGQESLGHRNRTGRQAGQHAVRAVAMGVELGLAELVGGERDGGLGIGHTQQGLGQPHQRQSLGAGDRVLAQQRLHRPEGRRLLAHRVHPGPGALHHLRPVERAGQALQRGGQHLVLTAIRVGKAVVFGRGDEHGKAPDWRQASNKLLG